MKAYRCQTIQDCSPFLIIMRTPNRQWTATPSEWRHYRPKISKYMLSWYNISAYQWIYMSRCDTCPAAIQWDFIHKVPGRGPPLPSWKMRMLHIDQRHGQL
jgi:hypothetical protein